MTKSNFPSLIDSFDTDRKAILPDLSTEIIKSLKGRDWRVYYILNLYRNRTSGTAFPSLYTLESKTGIPRNELRNKIIPKLVKLGLVIDTGNTVGPGIRVWAIVGGFPKGEAPENKGGMLSPEGGVCSPEKGGMLSPERGVGLTTPNKVLEQHKETTTPNRPNKGDDKLPPTTGIQNSDNSSSDCPPATQFEKTALTEDIVQSMIDASLQEALRNMASETPQSTVKHSENNDATNKQNANSVPYSGSMDADLKTTTISALTQAEIATELTMIEQPKQTKAGGGGKSGGGSSLSLESQNLPPLTMEDIPAGLSKEARKTIFLRLQNADVTKARLLLDDVDATLAGYGKPLRNPVGYVLKMIDKKNWTPWAGDLRREAQKKQAELKIGQKTKEKQQVKADKESVLPAETKNNTALVMEINNESSDLTQSKQIQDTTALQTMIPPSVSNDDVIKILMLIVCLDVKLAEKILEELETRMALTEKEPLYSPPNYVSKLVERAKAGTFSQGKATRQRKAAQEAEILNRKRERDDLAKQQAEEIARDEQKAKTKQLLESIGPERVAELKKQFISDLEKEGGFKFELYLGNNFEGTGFNASFHCYVRELYSKSDVKDVPATPPPAKEKPVLPAKTALEKTQPFVVPPTATGMKNQLFDIREFAAVFSCEDVDPNRHIAEVKELSDMDELSKEEKKERLQKYNQKRRAFNHDQERLSQARLEARKKVYLQQLRESG